MKRVLTCSTGVFWAGAFQAPQSWSDPRPEEYDVPDEWSNSGDDDLPGKTLSTPSTPGDSQAAQPERT